jgi:hypothetical protein
VSGSCPDLGSFGVIVGGHHSDTDPAKCCFQCHENSQTEPSGGAPKSHESVKCQWVTGLSGQLQVYTPNTTAEPSVCTSAGPESDEVTIRISQSKLAEEQEKEGRGYSHWIHVQK